MPLDIGPLRGIIDGITPTLKKFTKAAEENFYTIRNYINSLRLNSTVLKPTGTVDFNAQELDNVAGITIESNELLGVFKFYHGGGVGGSGVPSLDLYKSRGGLTPSVTLSGDTLGAIRFGGYTGAWARTSKIYAEATENFGASAFGTKLIATYTPNGGGSETVGLILNQDGNLTIGTVAGTGSKSLYLLDGNFAGAVYHVASTTAKPSGNLPEGTQPTTPSEGDYWVSSSQKTLNYYINSITNSAQFTFYIATANASVENTTTETSLIGTGLGTKTLPANFFIVGKTVRVKIRGSIGNTGTPTLQIKVKLGSTTILDTTALTLATVGATKRYFELEVEIVGRTTGTTGSIVAGGQFIYYSDDQTPNYISLHINGTISLNTTISRELDVTATWGTASASNYLRSRIATCEVIN